MQRLSYFLAKNLNLQNIDIRKNGKYKETFPISGEYFKTSLRFSFSNMWAIAIFFYYQNFGKYVKLLHFEVISGKLAKSVGLLSSNIFQCEVI